MGGSTTDSHYHQSSYVLVYTCRPSIMQRGPTAWPNLWLNACPSVSKRFSTSCVGSTVQFWSQERRKTENMSIQGLKVFALISEAFKMLLETYFEIRSQVSWRLVPTRGEITPQLLNGGHCSSDETTQQSDSAEDKTHKIYKMTSPKVSTYSTRNLRAVSNDWLLNIFIHL